MLKWIDYTGNHVLVLEYANGGNLREYLSDKKIFNSLQWKDKIQMALDITRGLKFLHSKDIIHRDLVNHKNYCFIYFILFYFILN